MMTTRSGRRGLLWALAGAVILVVGVIAIIAGTLLSRPPSPGPSSTASTPAASPSESADVPSSEHVVDESVADRGWVPEPITSDPEVYMRAALGAAATFDTTKSTRDEWLDYLDTWFTPDTRYTSEADQQEALTASQLELRQGVVLPESEWDSLSAEDGRLVASVEGDITNTPAPEDPSGDMQIGTGDVTLTFTRSDGNGGETSYEEAARVSVQVLCGAASVPAPDSGQQPGDCKVVRFFAESVEP